MEQRIELAPNGSLSTAGAWACMASSVAFSLPLTLLCAWRGLWPVLTYWMLEMAALGLALRTSMGHRFHTQTLQVTDSWISLVTRTRHGDAKEVFARHWTTVRLRIPQSPLHPSRLTIESRGRALEIGKFLMEDERRRLAARLRALVGGMNESPPLDNDNTLGDSLR